MRVTHYAALLTILLFCVYGGVTDDLVASVSKHDADSVLQQVGHGASANEPNSKGLLPLAQAGRFFSLFPIAYLKDSEQLHDTGLPGPQILTCPLEATKRNMRLYESGSDL